MKKQYIVTMQKVVHTYSDVTVIAENEEDALEAAWDKAENDHTIAWDDGEEIAIDTVEIQSSKKLTEADEVYYWYSATDCDGMHVEHAVKFSCQMEADEAIEDEAYNAEGAYYFEALSKKQYTDAKGQSIRHDRAAEAMGY